MKNLLVYYGWLNSFNSARNGWNNDLVADEIAHLYDVIVLGDGVADPSHGDFANASYIIAKLKIIKPEMKIFGYASSALALAAFQTKVDQWDALKVHGIFMDEAGYDFGVTRADFNSKASYVGAKLFAKTPFVNAWNLDHVLGNENDVSFPNTTFNPSLTPSVLKNGDYVLLESFGISSAVPVWEPAHQTFSRALKARKKVANFGVKLFSISIIPNAASDAQFKFNYISKLASTWCLTGMGSSDTSYGASSAAVTFWNHSYT